MPRYYWLRRRTFNNTVEGFDLLMESLDELEGCTFLLRETDARDGNPFNATQWTRGPCQYAQASRARQIILQAAGVPEDVAKGIGLHAFRRCLPEVAAQREEDGFRRVQVGRWSGNYAQDTDMTPTGAIITKMAERNAVMPDLYAHNGRGDRVCDILDEQIEAIYRVYSRYSMTELPWMHGWELCK
jgi:hypothetical protein